MTQLLPYIQVILSILLIIGVLLQRSEDSLGAGFGSDSTSGRHFLRRGFEKTLFNGTILIAILFVLSAIVPLFLGR
ncbi:MAG: preprotein translocase subunit SecG [Patescibacteria group bacterium]